MCSIAFEKYFVKYYEHKKDYINLFKNNYDDILKELCMYDLLA